MKNFKVPKFPELPDNSKFVEEIRRLTDEFLMKNYGVHLQMPADKE